jgi:hypothetical protein
LAKLKKVEPSAGRKKSGDLSKISLARITCLAL